MNKNILIVLGGGALLYWWYSKQQPATAAPIASPSPGTAGPIPAPGSTAATPPASATTSANQRQQIVSAINASGVSNTFIYGQQGPDTWNWYAMQAFPGWTAPSPETLYPGEPNVHTKTYTFDDWFSRVQQYLPTVGMSGLGAYRVTGSPYVGPGGWRA